MLTRWLYNSCPVCEITSNQRDRLKKSGHLRTFFLWPIPFLKLHSSKSIKSLLTSSPSECSRSPLRLSWLDEGATVPFIARYRKEVTGNLDDTQLRSLEERLLYLRELQERRDVVLASIEEQGKLADELRAAIEAVPTKQLLEDIYLPYKPKRRTRAQIAREAGLEPLADAALSRPHPGTGARSGQIRE